MPDLDAAAVVRVLNRHGVRYVIIGGIAAQVRDLPVPATVDIDVTHPDVALDMIEHLVDASLPE